MYAGPGPAFRTYTRPTYKKTTKVREKTVKLALPNIDPLAGHPELRFKRGVKAGDIYSLGEFVYAEQERMEIRVDKFLPAVPGQMGAINWDWVTDQRKVPSYTVAELTDIARSRGLQTSGMTKSELVSALWDDKERRERARAAREKGGS